MNSIITIFFLIFVTACRDPGTNEVPNPDASAGDAAKGFEGEGQPSADAVQEVVVNAPSASPDGGSEARKEADSVVPPRAITGAYLIGRVLDDGPARKMVGLAAYSGEMRLTQMADRFKVSWNLSQPLEGVSTTLENSIDRTYDVVVTMESKSVAQLDQQVKDLEVYLHVDDHDNPIVTLSSVYDFDLILSETKQRDEGG